MGLKLGLGRTEETKERRRGHEEEEHNMHIGKSMRKANHLWDGSHNANKGNIYRQINWLPFLMREDLK